MSGIFDRVLASFPAHTHPLTVVSDLDDVLADELLWAALLARGFRIVRESDPFALRVAIQRNRPWSDAEPLIVVTAGPLEALPYELWQQGRRVVLDLHQLFLNLSYPLVRQLSPGQRARLAAAMQTAGAPARMLAEGETAAYLLRHVFALPLDPPPSVASLLVWLADYCASGEPMPLPIAAYLLKELKAVPALRGLALDELLADPDAYPRFIQRAWESYVQRLSHAAESGAAPDAAGLSVLFATDAELQDALPALVRRAALRPVTAPAGMAAVPEWAQPALVSDAESAGTVELAEGLAEVERWLNISELRWEDWQTVARRWAEVTRWRYDPALRIADAARTQYDELAMRLDDGFAAWLQTHYSRLAGRVLPVPHHLYHVPQLLAHRRQQPGGAKPALLVLDGMSLADWVQIREVWQARHAGWQMRESLVLAQVPSITAVSRLALISGRRPDRFTPAELHNRKEAQLWTAFWEEHSIGQAQARYEHLSGAGEFPAAISSFRTEALCLVSTTIDDMVHGTTQGAPGMHAALDVWLRPSLDAGSAWLERLIQLLLDNGYSVALTSDHGHVEATGIGPLQEGVLAGTRSKRARVYSPAVLAQSARARYPATILWEPDGLLPPDISVLMPAGRGAFVSAGERIVSHGGLTLDEMVVPLITIAKK